jgi:Rieske Fe-S protein
VCTHLGCLLRTNAEAGRLDCPCHRTSFAPDGTVEFSQLSPAPRPLPTIGVRNRAGAVEVFVPDRT